MEFISASAFEALDASLLSSEMTEADSCTVVGIFVLNHGTQKQKIPGELTERRDAPKLEKLFACRGSSLVERRPEKAGVASSILAPGTTSLLNFLKNLKDFPCGAAMPVQEMEIFCDQGSSATGGDTAGTSAEEAGSAGAGVSAAGAGALSFIAGGATLRVSMGSSAAFCSTHLAARPLSGLLVLNS